MEGCRGEDVASLYDIIAANGLMAGKDVGVAFLQDQTRMIEQAVRFDINNVAEYLAGQRGIDGWGVEDFPSPVPPFPNLWLEFQASALGSAVKTESSQPGVHQIGIHILSVDTTAFDEQSDCIQEALEQGYAVDQIRWYVRMTVVLRPKKQRPFIWATATYILDEDGVVQFVRGHSTPTMLFEGLAPVFQTLDADDWQGVTHETLRVAIYPAMLALSFSNCRNVAIEEVPPMPPKLARKFEQRHGKPPVTFRVLAIDPMREVLRREGRSESTGLKRALHICRGHFVTYSDERPMFGRLSGRFWVPSHTRGNLINGRIEKAYRVRAGA